MFLSAKEYNLRGISFDFGEGNGLEHYLILGDFLCECIHANSPSSYQDHVDLTWDYYTYRTDQITNGIVHPSVAPNGQINQTYGVDLIGINNDCWVNSLFGSAAKPIFPHSVSFSRSFGASYFTQNFYPGVDCDGDYNETCYTDPDIQEQLILEIFSICDGGIDKARKKIGLYGPGQSTVTFISPTVASFCAHCVGDGAATEQVVRVYNPTTQQFQSITIDLYPINYNQYTQRLKNQNDMRIGKIRTAGVSFPTYYQYYLNPFSFQEYISLTGKDLNQKLAAFMVNANGVFALWYYPFSTFNALSQLNVASAYSAPLISGKSQEFIKNVRQPKSVSVISGDSGTNFMYFSKSGTSVWPVGAIAGQTVGPLWKLFNGRYGIDDINDFLALLGEPTLTEFVDYDSLYKIEDFIPQTSAENTSMKINTKKFNKKSTVQTNKYGPSGSIKKVKIQKEVIVERNYR